MIFISPISPVFEQCVPPQSSSEKSPARTMRTVFPYFSPNSAIAPAAFADSMSVSTEVTSSASRMVLVHELFDLRDLFSGESLEV